MLRRVILIIGALAIVVAAVGIIFADELFTKKDAALLLSEVKIKLQDDFKIISNESNSAPGDYYHTFVLEISRLDKQRLINEIKNSEGFEDNVSETKFETPYPYGSKTIIESFATKSDFVRKHFEHMKH